MPSICSNNFGCKKYSDRIGVLIANLGTPDRPDASALRPYLKQFLSDRRVIEVNRFLWWFILNGIVLRTRPKRSAALYKRIWTDEGSPLLCTTKSQASKLQAELDPAGERVLVAFGMRYGTPSIEKGIDELIDKGCTRIVLFPMYPHYSAATSASTYDAVFPHILKRRWVPTLRVAEPYFRDPRYLKALAGTINRYIQSKLPKPEVLMLSYHGIPRAYIEKGDPYCCMCNETTARLKPLLNTSGIEVTHTFQSRFGKDPWLTPYTEDAVVEFGKRGVKRIAVACPGFTADCLETLDEIGNEAKHLFLENGGESLSLIPCLNDDDMWISAMSEIIRDEIGSWLNISGEENNGVTCPLTRAVGER